MRTLTTQEGKVLSGGRLNTPVRLQVKDAGGTWRDLTALFGRDWVRSWEVDEDVDQPVAQLRCSLAREAYHDSLSALRTDTRPNLTTGSYAPLLAPGAEVKLDVAILPEGIAPASGDWRNIFHGDIDRVELASNPMSFTARDLGGRLQDLWIQADREYGSDVGVDMEEVFQAIIDHAHGETFEAGAAYAAAAGTTHGDRVTPTSFNGFWYRVTTGGTAGAEPIWPVVIGGTVTSGGVTFTCAGRVPGLLVPVSPAFLITTYRQQPQSVLEAIRGPALSLIGWDLRYRWSTFSSQFELTLSVPDRSNTTPAYTWDADHYYAVPDFSIDRATVRSQVDVIYSDSTDLDPAGVPKRKTESRQDKDSMDKWSGGLPRWMQLAESETSQIDTSGEAGILAANALSDLKDPKAIAAFDLPLFPFAELGDLYRFAADNVRYNADQDLAVTGIRHSGSAGGAVRTTVRVTGRPVVAVEQWLRIESGEIVPSHFEGPHAPTNVAVAQVQGGLSVTWTRAVAGAPAADFEVHASTSSGFTPSSSTLKGVTDGTAKTIADLEPGTTYYIKVVPRDRQKNRGTASTEVSTAAGYTPPRAMQPRVRFGLVPMNADLEGWAKGSGFPPDSWVIDSGPAWGVSFTRSDERLSGTYAVKLQEAANLAVGLKSDPFPANVEVLHRAWGWVKFSATTSLLVTVAVQWFDEDDVAISQTATTLAGDDTDWHRVEFVTTPPSGAVYGVFKFNKSQGDAAYILLDSVGVERVEDSTTISPSFNTGWGNFGSGFQAASLERTAGARVHPSGSVVRSSGSASLVWTAPAGWRPGATRRVMLDATASLECRANGEMHILNATNSVQYSLEQMQPFLAEG